MPPWNECKATRLLNTITSESKHWKATGGNTKVGSLVSAFACCTIIHTTTTNTTLMDSFIPSWCLSSVVYYFCDFELARNFGCKSVFVRLHSRTTSRLVLCRMEKIARTSSSRISTEDCTNWRPESKQQMEYESSTKQSHPKREDEGMNQKELTSTNCFFHYPISRLKEK